MNKRWSEEEVQFLKDNRFMSTQEIADALGKPHQSVREKRSRNKLPQLAECKSCGVTFKRINQHSQCQECTPDQKGYAATYRDSLNGRWQMYKNNAHRRDIQFYITIDEFAELWQKACVYCASEIETIGIDRVNSSKSYTVDNVVPCCARCNEMKMNASTEDWINQMKKILANLGELK